jgi:hypothetical protein
MVKRTFESELSAEESMQLITAERAMHNYAIQPS